MDGAYFLPSMASIATRIRICGVIWIRTPTPTTHGSAPPDTRRTRSSTGFAVCRDGLPVRGCIRGVCVRGATSSTNAGQASAMPREPRHPTLQMVPLHVQFGRGPADAFLPGDFDRFAQSSSGIAAFPFRFCLRASKRALASSSVIVGVLLRGMAFSSADSPAADRPYQLCWVEFMQACRKDTSNDGDLDLH